MVLSKLLEGIPVTKMFQTAFGQMVVTHETEVRHIQYDSRKITREDAFIAIKGTDFDGHQFIDDAISRGARVVVVQDDAFRTDSFFLHAGVIKVVVADTRRALAKMSANFYGHPSKDLRLIGITGTNGKTTTAFLMSWLLEKSGLIGTNEYHIGKEVMWATHTTPESLELNQLLSRMVEQGCTTAVMEVSSHAMHQHRVDGMAFEAAIFTNLTQDHLDYHGTMGEYFDAKKILFDTLPSNATAVTNVDDEFGLKIVKDSRARTLTYGVNARADVRAKNIELSIEGTKFVAVHKNESTPVESSLIGKFNVYNILAGFSGGLALGLSKETLQRKIAEFKSVRGRFERVRAPKNFTVIIDYAHTPDALMKCLETIQDIFQVDPSSGPGRIVTVFGCGGNRDRGKRPRMARIATRFSAVTIVTSDNPRHEDPEAIIDEVIAGIVPGTVVYRQADRRKAIEQALDLAQAGDVVLIAGKGHETEQVIGNQKTHFSDHEVVDGILRVMGQ